MTDPTHPDRLAATKQDVADLSARLDAIASVVNELHEFAAEARAMWQKVATGPLGKMLHRR